MSATISPCLKSRLIFSRSSTSPCLISQYLLERLLTFITVLSDFLCGIGMAGFIFLRNFLSTSSGAPSSIICPFSSQSTRWARYECTSGRWETTRVLSFNFSFTFFIVSRTPCFVAGQVMVAGSSRRRRCGFAASCLAISNLCFSPPLNTDEKCSAFPSRFTSFRYSRLSWYNSS
ncbi:Uncharacterised protein [uncultured archaeon]|nr:Uncharacterised protein [uncultured archaeon]